MWVPRLVATFPASALALLLGSILSLAAPTAPQAPNPRWVWFEAEPDSPPGTDSPQLSQRGMRWLSPGASFQRPISIPSPGTYHLWVRKFWNPQAFRWRIGSNTDWNDTPSPALTDLVVLDGNAGRRVGWANVGTVTLPAGPQSFQLEVPASDANTTAYDCFLLTRDPFQPRGHLRPGEVLEVQKPGWFAFNPVPDSFQPSPIDLRHLNEFRAGDQGFIRVRGEEFIHETTGEPVRFWAVNIGMDFVRNAPSELETFARSLAKRGVNLVRIHGPIYPGEGTDFHRVDPGRITQLQRLVHLLKHQGIYSSLSLYFPLWVKLGPNDPRFPGYAGKHPFALLYFDPDFQQLYRDWWRAVLTAPNPFSALPLKDDPAIAFAEMYNEDSTLFWTFNPDAGPSGNIPDPLRARIESDFASWLVQRYPGLSLDQIRDRHWDRLATPQDALDQNRIGIRGLWNIANQRTRRDQDTARFLTERMRQFHRETDSYLKTELGFRGLLHASNWKTASPQFLDPLDKYANATADFLDRHGYFGGVHQGPNASWNLEVQQTYDDRSALRFLAPDHRSQDFALPLWDPIYQGKPSTITEINWPLPNRFRADMILAGAAYGALQGTDALAWFAAATPAWDGLPGKFSIQTPVVQGQFPAAALIYRQGLIRTAPRVVDLQLAVDDLFALKGSPLPTPQNFDQLRSADIPPGGSLPGIAAIDPLAFLVGRVGIDFLEQGTPTSRILDLSPYIDRPGKTVHSHTRELQWDWGMGQLLLRAPAAQGITGFLKDAGPVDLPDLAIHSTLDYGALVLVTLDRQPIAHSTNLLLQVASEEIPMDWATRPESGMRTLTHRGTLPLLVREFTGTVRLKRADAPALRVTPLDFNGHPLRAAYPHAATIELLPQTPYYHLEK